MICEKKSALIYESKLALLQLLLKQPSFSTTDDFSNLNRAFEMLEVLSNVPNYDPKKKVILKLKRGVHKVDGNWMSPYDSTRQQRQAEVVHSLRKTVHCQRR